MTKTEMRSVVTRLQELLLLASVRPLFPAQAEEVTGLIERLAPGLPGEPDFRGRAILLCLDLRKAARWLTTHVTAVEQMLADLQYLEHLLD